MNPQVSKSTALVEAEKKVSVLAERLHGIFEEAGPDRDFSKVKLLQGDTAGKIAQVRTLNKELEAAHDEAKGLEEMENIAGKVRLLYNTPANPILHPGGGPAPREIKSLGKLFIESQSYQENKGNNWPRPLQLPNVDIRAAVFRTGAGWDPETLRIDRVELTPLRPIAVIDNIPMLPTTQDAIEYMEETTFTNNAVETAESTATTASDLIGEGALALTLRSRKVEWLPTFLPVTQQQMEDVDGIEAYVNSRLIYMLRARLDLQVLAGNGTSPNLLGTESVTGIQSQALGADNIPDAIYKLFTKIRDDGFAEPSVLFIRPAKFQTVRLERTADGLYIWGHPSTPGPFTLFGVPIVQTNAVTATKAISGDFANFSALYTKRGITIAVSDSHAFYFTRGMLAIRADMRIAMVHFRPKAFGEVTGL